MRAAEYMTPAQQEALLETWSAQDYVLRDDGYHYIDNDEDDGSGDHIAAPASPKLYLTSVLDNDAGD